MTLPRPGGLPSLSEQADSPDSRLQQLVRQYAKLVRYAVRKVGGSRLANDAEDVEQAVFLGLWQQLRAEQTISHPASYVYKAAVRETVRAVRRLRHPPGEVAEMREPVSDEPGPERRATGQEVTRAVADVLASMQPDRVRAVRAHLQGLTAQEMMALYGWSYQKTRNLITRGMADLRAALRQRGLP